jgi:hypothetical protein
VDKLWKESEVEGPWSVEVITIEAQELLQKELQAILDKSSDKDRQEWDSVAEDHYERVTHRIGSSIALGYVILHGLRNGNSYPPQPQE